jgi:hypothetical protein
MLAAERYGCLLGAALRSVRQANASPHLDRQNPTIRIVTSGRLPISARCGDKHALRNQPSPG